MTSFVETDSVTVDAINNTYKHTDSDVNCCKNRERRNVLKSKHKSYKHKCNKLLRRKLKKYKLRQDGTEDQDVIDVSKILVSSLKIKSPNNLKDPFIGGEFNHFDELRPRNYLFKMVRRKETIKTNSGQSPRIIIKDNETIEEPEVINNQEKKHTNAFQLLMDSRNKSIGSNSPGKERSDDHTDTEEILEKKNLKIKRNLLLQKMAETKGNLKNKEMDEYQGKIIKKKMDKRAERLKLMIKKDTKPVKLVADSTNKKEIKSPKIKYKEENVVTNNNESKNKSKTLKMVDIFNTLSDPVIVSPEKKHIPKEDKEFLKKLSPSLKKKESMLSYFKKVDKESESSPVDSDNDNLIKVKFQVKPKKKGRKKKLSLKRDTIDLDLEDTEEINDENNEMICDSNTPLPKTLPVAVENSELTNSHGTNERQKRKRNTKIDILQSSEADNPAIDMGTRPKRSIKRPIKYTDDAGLSSSDEDLQIFTPKKKKHMDNTHNDKVPENSKTKNVNNEPAKSNIEKKMVKEANISKKPVKIAPIFASKQLDTAALEAKQRFLQSGVPEKLKKQIQQQIKNNILSSDFPVVVHIQQQDLGEVKNVKPLFNLLEDNDKDICPLNVPYEEEDAFKKLLNLNEAAYIDNRNKSFKKSTQTILQNIKLLHPKFPVYRTYHYLRGKSKGEIKDCNIEFNNSIEVMQDVVDIINDSPDRLNWTDKYKAITTNQIIGNFESIKELRKWLIVWTENEMKSKSKGNAGSDSSDYYQSDGDSRDSLKSMNNLLILTGPTGCGKTSSVYAVAAELAMKVIEVNASSKRTGKIMLQDLQEATQSHKVNRGTISADNSQKSQEKNLTEQMKKSKKRGRPKKSTENINKKSIEKTEVLSSTPLSQESTRTDMSLILIDDADIVFEQDDGFSSAIVQLVQCSKRPVILITSSLQCSHLQRFLVNGKILTMCPLLPRLLGTWLDIMCLADSGISWPGEGAKFLDYFNGDIRKTVNYLQFYILSQTHISNTEDETASQNVDYYKSNIDEENSSMSWADREDLEGRKLTPISFVNTDKESNTMWTDFVDNYSNLLKLRYPMQLFNIWWSIPQLLSDVPNISNAVAKTGSKKQKVQELEMIADAIDAISLSDYLTNNDCDSNYDVTANPWQSSENDSVSEQDNLDYYMSKYEVGDELCHTLVKGCITRAQDVLCSEQKTEISFPGMSLQRERDKIVSRHKSLTSYLNPWAMLDRRSLALDYWSSCRTICRVEKSKSEANVNTKRNNRFCHYLKSLSILCKSDTFDNLCDSLSDQGTELNDI